MCRPANSVERSQARTPQRRNVWASSPPGWLPSLFRVPQSKQVCHPAKAQVLSHIPSGLFPAREKVLRICFLACLTPCVRGRRGAGGVLVESVALARAQPRRGPRGALGSVRGPMCVSRFRGDRLGPFSWPRVKGGLRAPPPLYIQVPGAPSRAFGSGDRVPCCSGQAQGRQGSLDSLACQHRPTALAPSAPPGPGLCERKGDLSPPPGGSPPPPLPAKKEQEVLEAPTRVRAEKERRGPGLSYPHALEPESPGTRRPRPQPRLLRGPQAVPTAACAESPAPVGGGGWRARGAGPAGHIPWQAAPGTGGQSVHTALGEGRPRKMNVDSWRPGLDTVAGPRPFSASPPSMARFRE